MCAQPVVYPQRRPIFSTTQLGWLPVPYYTQQFPWRYVSSRAGSWVASYILVFRGWCVIDSLYF